MSWLIVAIVLGQWILANILGVSAFLMAFSPIRHKRATAVIGGTALLYGLFLAAYTFRPWVRINWLDAMTFAPIVLGGIALAMFWRAKDAIAVHNNAVEPSGGSGGL